MRSPSRQHGLAVVELAVITPFLLVMLMLAFEFTRVFYQYNALTKSVRDAARLAVTDAYDGTNQFQLSNQTVTAARNLAASGSIAGGAGLLPGLSAQNFTVTTVVLGAAPLEREHVRVTGNYDYQPFSPVLSGFGFLPADVGLEFTLTASATMRGL